MSNHNKGLTPNIVQFLGLHALKDLKSIELLSFTFDITLNYCFLVVYMLIDDVTKLTCTEHDALTVDEYWDKTAAEMCSCMNREFSNLSIEEAASVQVSSDDIDAMNRGWYVQCTCT